MQNKNQETMIENNFVSKCFYSLTALLIGELFCRVTDLILEIYRNKQNSLKKERPRITKRIPIFNFTYIAKIFLYFYFLFLTLYLNEPGFFKNIFENILISVTYYIVRKLQIDSSYLDQAKWIRSGSGLDYGSGMASNYFNGYIRLCLPERGDGRRGIVERCQDYEADQNVKFITKKLIILIPQSMRSKPKFQSKLLQLAANPLPAIINNRAGVERPYQNSVYRFTEPINGEFYYIVLEGATPLLSFWESCEDSQITSTEAMKIMEEEICLQFYKSIKKYCQNCMETKNEVDFIFYEDYKNGQEVDIGDVVKAFIKDLK